MRYDVFSDVNYYRMFLVVTEKSVDFGLTANYFLCMSTCAGHTKEISCNLAMCSISTKLSVKINKGDEVIIWAAFAV